MRIAVEGQALEAKRAGRMHRAVIAAKSKPLGVIAAVLLMAILLLAVAAPLVAPYDPYAHDLDNKWSGPTSQHIMGTDQYGRDTFSRLLQGGRWSLLIAFSATFIGGTAGAMLGLVSAYNKGTFDLVIQRFVDIKLSVPNLLLTFLIVLAVGPTVFGVIVALSVASLSRGIRVIRSVALSASSQLYVEAAKAMGASGLRVVFRHVLPSCTASYIIIISVAMGGLIVAEAALGFLGLGVQPPTPTWGQMLNRSMEAIRLSPWVPFFPGLAIFITVFAFNMLGDAIRDVLDPKLRGR